MSQQSNSSGTGNQASNDSVNGVTTSNISNGAIIDLTVEEEDSFLVPRSIRSDNLNNTTPREHLNVLPRENLNVLPRENLNVLPRRRSSPYSLAIHDLILSRNLPLRNLDVSQLNRDDVIEHLSFISQMSATITPTVVNNFDIIRKPRNKLDGYVEGLSCIICFEENVGNVILEPCKHNELCDTCIKKWIEYRQTCPICRTQITNITIFCEML